MFVDGGRLPDKRMCEKRPSWILRDGLLYGFFIELIETCKLTYCFLTSRLERCLQFRLEEYMIHSPDNSDYRSTIA